MSPDGHARCVDVTAIARQRLNGLRLLRRRKNADRAVDALAPLASLGRWRALVIETDDDVALLRKHCVIQPKRSDPRIAYCGAGRLAINKGDHGILLRGVTLG